MNTCTTTTTTTTTTTITTTTANNTVITTAVFLRFVTVSSTQVHFEYSCFVVPQVRFIKLT
jgi:hypothetical protein